jgi:hypothetical protein
MTGASPPGGGPRPRGTLARIAGILVSPRATFAEVVAHPRWLGVLAVVTVVTAVCTGALLMTETGQQASLDQQVSTMESFGMTVTDEMYAQLEQRVRFGAYFAAGSILVVGPLMTLVMAGLLFGVFSVMGGEATFKALFAVVVHAGAVMTVQQLFVSPLNYLRGSVSSPTNLGVFLPMLDESGFVARFLGVVDLFYIWWLVVLAIGLSVLYRRRTGPIATSLLAVYAAIALTIATVVSILGGA